MVREYRLQKARCTSCSRRMFHPITLLQIAAMKKYPSFVPQHVDVAATERDEKNVQSPYYKIGQAVNFFCSVASVKVRQHSPSFARDRRLTNCDHLLGVNPGHGESWHSYHILLVEQKLPYHSELLPLPPTHPQPSRDECPCSYTVQATLQVGHYRAGTLGGATVKCGTVLPSPMSSSMQRTPGMDLICVPLRGWGWGGGGEL